MRTSVAILGLFILLGTLAGPVSGAESGGEFGLNPPGIFNALPDGIVNVCLPHFGQDVIIGGDLGLGNVVPVELVQLPTPEVRIFRSPEISISAKRQVKFQVRLGDVSSLYVWIDTPPVQGDWRVNIDLIYPDGMKRTIFQKNMKPGVRDWFPVEPFTVLECSMRTRTTALKLNRRFNLTFSPAQYAVWPEFFPSPYRTIFD